MNLGRWLILGLLWVNAAVAEVDTGEPSCDLSFAQSLTVDGEMLEVADWRFDGQGGITRAGKPLALTPEQQALAASYVGEVQALVPELLALVREAVKLVGRALGETFGELFGHDSEMAVKTEQAMAVATARLDQRIQQKDGRYHLSHGEKDLFDEAFGEKFDQAVDEAAGDAVGSGMSLVWRALFEPGFAERMEAFGERMEKEMEAAAASVEARGDAMCQRARVASGLEQRLRETVPELAHFRLLEYRLEAGEVAGAKPH